MSAATQDELLIQRQYRLLEKLNESNRKYDRLIKSLSSVVFETDAEGNWTFLNPAWETITGFSVAESLGKNFLYFIYPDDREKVMRESTEMRELKDDSFRSQFRYIHKTNQYIWVEVDANTLFDNQGNMAGTAGTLVNIQQQVEAMHALQEKDHHLQAAHTALETSERRLKYALEGANEGVWDWNIQTGEVYFSPRWIEMLDYAPGEIAPHVSSWEHLVHPDDMPEVMRVLQQHLDGKIDLYETTHRVKNKEGEWQWIQDRGKIVEYDNNGSPLRAVGTHLDVSDRIKTEQSLAMRTDQLARANLELDEILNISPVGFISFGANNKSTFYTPRFAALVNINDKILGISIGKAKQHIIDNNKLLPARPEQDTNEFIIYNREADKVIKIRTTSSGSQSQPAQLMAAIDITQEHNLDRMKTYFMSAASHELRTPLSSVCGFSELLLESADLFSRDEQKEMLTSIYTQAMSLKAIVTQLLDVSRIESGLKPTPHPETFDLSKHIAQLISAFTPRERNHSIEYACGEACEINSDPEFINRIITNLLSNACKYSEHGLTVEIALKRQQLKERDGYAIRITDHGIGMAKEDREKAFDKFFRADKSRKVQGMGLGLHITRQLTDALQGFVCLDAGEDGGTVAHIWLPEEIEEKNDA